MTMCPTQLSFWALGFRGFSPPTPGEPLSRLVTESLWVSKCLPRTLGGQGLGKRGTEGSGGSQVPLPTLGAQPQGGAVGGMDTIPPSRC